MTETFLTKSFMQQFCSTDSLRPVLTVIFPAKDYYVASNSYELLMAKQSVCAFETDYNQDVHGPTLQVFTVCNPEKLAFTHRLMLSSLRDYISSIATEDEIEYIEVPTEFKECDCDECNYGRITLECHANWRGKYLDLEDEIDCPICHGFGKIPVDPEYDPDECFGIDDVEHWITYEHRKTGRKIIGPDTITHIAGLAINAKFLNHILLLMEYFGIDQVDFFIDKQMIVFNVVEHKVYYLFMSVYEEGCCSDGCPFTIGDVPVISL